MRARAPDGGRNLACCHCRHFHWLPGLQHRQRTRGGDARRAPFHWWQRHPPPSAPSSRLPPSSLPLLSPARRPLPCHHSNLHPPPSSPPLFTSPLRTHRPPPPSLPMLPVRLRTRRGQRICASALPPSPPRSEAVAAAAAVAPCPSGETKHPNPLLPSPGVPLLTRSAHGQPGVDCAVSANSRPRRPPPPAWPLPNTAPPPQSVLIMSQIIR